MGIIACHSSEPMDLHVAYQQTSALDASLGAWDRLIADEPAPVLHRWTRLAAWPAARSATVAASTAIEGNQLTPAQVDNVLRGVAVNGRPTDIRDIHNYNRALDLANRFALRDDFEWSQELIRRLNATIIDGLDDDERGEYRRAPVIVGGVYEPPDHRWVPGLMSEFVEWLNGATTEHMLIGAGLAHLNVVSIHPWLNGNGRTSRVVGSLALMRGGIAAPELVNIESVIRADPDAYVSALQTSHGAAYAPDRHSATPWLEYFAAIAVDRLDLRTRLLEAIRSDIGFLAMELDSAGMPTDWAPVIAAARNMALRAADVSEMLGLSASRARAILAECVRAGWLIAIGQTRGRRYEAARRLTALPSRSADLVDRLRRGAPVES
jgi:Fic family protein